MKVTNDVFRNLGISKQDFIKSCLLFFSKLSIALYCFIFISVNTILYGLTGSLFYSIIFILILTLGLLQVLDKRYAIVKKLNFINFILSNPYLLRMVVKSKNDIDKDGVTDIPLKDFNSIDRRMIKNYARYYKNFKFVIPTIIYAVVTLYILMFCKIYNIRVSNLVYSLVLLTYIIILTIYAICNIFKNVYVKMFYKGFTTSTDRLFAKGYLTGLQFKAIYICNARYLEESILSDDECKYIIEDNIVSKRDLARDYIDFQFKYLSNSVVIGLAIMGILYILLNSKRGINLNYLLAWLVLIAIVRYAIQFLHGIVLKYYDKEEFVNKIVNKMHRDDALLSNFILNRLPNEILEQL